MSARVSLAQLWALAWLSGLSARTPSPPVTARTTPAPYGPQRAAGGPR